MKRSVWTSVAALLVVAASASSAWADQLFAVSGSSGAASTLFELDPNTGAVIRTIGATGFSHVTGIDFDPTTGTLYGVVSGSGQLITINLTTGAGTVVGNTGAQIPDIAFNGSGTLFGWIEPGADDLATINLTTGAVSIIADSGLSTAQLGLAFSPSGVLFVKSQTTLHTFNPATGTSTGSIALGAASLQNMLAFDINGVMYSGVRGGGFTLVTINPTTGAVTTVGSNALSNISAIAFIHNPEPGTIALMGLGLVGLGAFVRRRRAARVPSADARS